MMLTIAPSACISMGNMVLPVAWNSFSTAICTREKHARHKTIFP